MPLEEVVTNASTDFIIELGKIGKWVQAVGLVIILWLIFQIILIINNRIRRKRLKSIEEKLETIENKLDRALRKKK